MVNLRCYSGGFEDDELLAYAEQQIDEEIKSEAKQQSDDEDDPLDAFMAGIETVIKKQDEKKAQMKESDDKASAK